MKSYSIEQLKGKTIKKVTRNDDQIIFECKDGEQYSMAHEQDCCEQVYIEDINGYLDDLVGRKILEAYESTNKDNPKNKDEDSFTWTFYTIRNNKTTITIRWYGSSNGYYSESVDVRKI